MISASEDKKFYHRLIADVVTVGLFVIILPTIYGVAFLRTSRESILLASLLFVAASFLGCRITSLWYILRRQGGIAFRSKLAVRSSGLFLRNLERLEIRLTELLSRHVKSPASEVVITSQLEEIILACRGI